MKKIRWGIIGPGEISKQFVRDLSLLEEPFEIAAILGNSKEGIKEFTDEFETSRSFQDEELFFKEADFDMAYVATPHTLHHRQVLACLEKGIPVLCEKPITINKEQCEELVRLSREKKTFLMEGMWLRFLPSIRQLLKLLAEDKIGKIISIKAAMCYKAPYDPKSRYFNPDLGGGSLLDLGIYPVFLAYTLLGKPSTIKAIGSLSDQGIDETCSVLFQFDKSQHAILESSIVTESRLPAEISGEKGIIRILNPWFEKAEGLELEIFGEEKKIIPTDWEGHGLQFETREMLDCINKGQIESKIMPHQASLDMMQIMDEIRRQIHVSYKSEE